MIKNKIFRNASWIIGCRILQSVFSLIITMLSARFLEPTNYGLINYAASIVAFVVPIMQLGLNNILVLELVSSPDDEGEILGTSIFMSLGSAFLSIAGVISFVSIANRNEPETILVCALYSILLIFQALDLIQYWFQAKYLSKFTAITTLIAGVCVSLYKVAILVTSKSVYWFAMSYAIDYFLISVTLIIIYKKLKGKGFRFSWQRAISLFRKSRYYMLSSFMLAVFAQTDKIMLKLLIDNAATGYYTAAVTCSTLTAFVFAAIIDSFRPSIFEAKATDPKNFETGMVRLYSVIIYLSFAQSIGMMIFSKLVIGIIYGGAYAPAISILRLAVWATPFSYIGSVRNIWILAEGKQKYLWVINLLGAVVNLTANYISITLWGIMGAALSSVITQLFTNVLLGFIIKPIRRNNVLMIKALNPMNLLKLIKK